MSNLLLENMIGIEQASLCSSQHRQANTCIYKSSLVATQIEQQWTRVWKSKDKITIKVPSLCSYLLDAAFGCFLH